MSGEVADLGSRVVVLVLPGPGAVDATLASVRAEAGDDIALFDAHEGGSRAVSGVAVSELRAAGDLLAPIRAGDRWRAGTLVHRLRPLLAHPTAAFGVAGHTLVTPAGDALRSVSAPSPAVDPAQLLLRPTIEASAVVVRTTALTAEAIDLLTRPDGDAAVWSELKRRHGLLPSGEDAADVLVTPDRHGHAPHARLDGLLAAAAADDAGGTDGMATVRRELLRRLWLDGDDVERLAELDMKALLGERPDERAVEVVADLQWALERQRDALRAERVRWSEDEVDPDERLPALADEELLEARLKAEEIWYQLNVRNAEIRRLEAEIERRDALLARHGVDPGAI